MNGRSLMDGSLKVCLFCRVSLLLIITLIASACAPVSRAQGLDQNPSHAAASASAASDTQTSSADALASDTYAPRYRLFQPQVMQVAQANPVPSAPRAWFDLSLQPQLLDFFNAWAEEGDIARIEHVSMLDLLDQVTVGRKLVVFKNAVDAEEAVPLIADQMDIIGYNLEGGPANLPEEQADPVGAARRMRNLADAYGLKVALGPNRDFAIHYGVEMAPYVDLFILQVQRVQTEHDTVREFVLPMMESLLEANPDLEISVQLRTEGNVDQLITLVDSLGPELAGVSILTSQNTLPTAYALVEAIDEWRRSAPATPTPDADGGSGGGTGAAPSASPDAASPTATATPNTEPRRTPTQTAEPVTNRPTPPTDGPTRWFLFGSGLVFGLLLAMLGGTWLVFMVQRMRTR